MHPICASAAMTPDKENDAREEISSVVHCASGLGKSVYGCCVYGRYNRLLTFPQVPHAQIETADPQGMGTDMMSGGMGSDKK
jgi:hypothetical protein